MSDLTVFNQPEMAQAFIDGTESFDSANGIGGTGYFLKVEQNSGDWVYGAADELVEEDAIWAINIGSFEQGWICWSGRALIGRHARKANEPPMMEHELPALPAGQDWKPMKKFDLKCVGGSNHGVEVTYETSSLGGLRALSKITRAIGERCHAGESDIIPVVALSSHTYPNKISGKDVRNPDFNIVGWSDGNSIPDITQPVLEEEPAVKTRARRRK